MPIRTPRSVTFDPVGTIINALQLRQLQQRNQLLGQSIEAETEKEKASYLSDVMRNVDEPGSYKQARRMFLRRFPDEEPDFPMEYSPDMVKIFKKPTEGLNPIKVSPGEQVFDPTTREVIHTGPPKTERPVPGKRDIDIYRMGKGRHVIQRKVTQAEADRLTAKGEWKLGVFKRAPAGRVEIAKDPKEKRRENIRKQYWDLREREFSIQAGVGIAPEVLQPGRTAALPKIQGDLDRLAREYRKLGGNLEDLARPPELDIPQAELPPGVTEADIQHTMKAMNMSRQEVIDAYLERIGQ